MADNTAEPKFNHLEEVKLDAEFNFKQRLREQEEKAKFEEQKQQLKQNNAKK